MTPGRCPNQPSPRWQRILLTAFREPGRHFFCERCLHPQLGDRGLVIPRPGPQADQLGPPGLAQRGIRVLPGLRGLSCHLHPLAKSHLMDADVPGDLTDRTATVKDESYRLCLVLRRKCAACRTHFSLSRRIGQLSRVSTEAGTVLPVDVPVRRREVPAGEISQRCRGAWLISSGPGGALSIDLKWYGLAVRRASRGCHPGLPGQDVPVSGGWWGKLPRASGVRTRPACSASSAIS